ncbi:hypothetical protein C8Q79DRAFT_1006790 [Trametes meyenii]|nr:hypothetical protein C8Q79DRAFT_1006790 [Trametes meyenii]
MPDVNVDSANTTAIQYESYGSAPWQLIETNNNGGVFAQTLTKAESTGGAVFRFHEQVVGTRVEVFGTLIPSTDAQSVANSSYSIDGAQQGTFSSSSSLLARVSEQDQQLFFDSGTLSDDDHVLVINVTVASTAEPYLIDFIRYTATAPASTSASSSATSSTAAATASPSRTASSSHSNVGPIVGGVVGGVLGLTLLIGISLFLFFRYFRHRIALSGRRKGGRDLVADLVENGKPGSDTDPSSTTPFMSQISGPGSGSGPWRSDTPTLQLAPPAPHAPSTVGPEDSASQVAGRIYAAELAQQAHEAGRSGGDSRAGRSTGGVSGSGPSSKADSRARSRGQDRKEFVAPQLPEDDVAELEPDADAVQHQDSGIRFREGEMPPALAGEVDERPPEYTPRT